MNKKYLGLALLAIVCGGLGIAFGNKQQATAAGAPAVGAAANASVAAPANAGKAAPVAALLAQTLPDAAGKAQSLAQWRGKVTVVNFWATWCPPCVQEMPELAALQAEVAPKDVHIIGIGIDSPSNIAEFSTKYKISYPLYVAGMSGTGMLQDFGNKAGSLPYTVLIGADGAIKKTYLGRIDFKQLRADLKAL